MPIAIACPSCGAKMKAPDEAAGRKVKCPKCSTPLVVPTVTLDEPPAPAPRPSGTGKGQVSRPATKPVDIFPINPEDGLPVVIESRPKRPARKVAARPRDDDYEDGGDYEEDYRRRGRPSVVVVQQGGGTDAPGVISLIFGCLSVACLLLGCFTCGVTYWAAVPFALLGGGVGFFGRGNMRVAGLVLNFLALIPATIVLVVFVGMAGLAGVGATVEPKHPDRKAAQQVAAPDQTPPEQPATKPDTPPPPTKSEPPTPPKAEPAPQTKSEPQWAYPEQSVVQGDLEVRFGDAAIGKVPVKSIINDVTMSTDDLLTIKVNLFNPSPTKKVEFHSWAGADFTLHRDYATLVDNFGNVYKRITFGLGSYPVGAIERPTAVYPNKSVTDVLVFQAPVDTAAYLDLELPANNYGCEGMIRFRIPLKTVRNSPERRTLEHEEAEGARKAAEERRRVEEEGRRAERERQRKADAIEDARRAQEAKAKRDAEDAAAADRRLAYAEKLLDQGETNQAVGKLRELIEKYPDTEAAAKARKVLKKVE